MLETLKQEDYKFYSTNGRVLESINHIACIELDTNKMRYGDNYVPFGYTQYGDGSILLQFLPNLKDFALEFIKTFDDLFCESAFDYAYNNIAGYLKQAFNLVPNQDRYKYSSVYYEISDKNKLKFEKKQNPTIKFDETCKYEIIEKYVFIDRENPGIYFGTLIDDKIVSVAKWNNYEAFAKYPELVKSAEIGIGTHEDYRGKGCAVSNVIAMAEYMLEHGICVQYCTESENIGSQKTAEAAGFTEMSREKLFWFRNDNK